MFYSSWALIGAIGCWLAMLFPALRLSSHVGGWLGLILGVLDTAIGVLLARMGMAELIFAPVHLVLVHAFAYTLAAPLPADGGLEKNPWVFGAASTLAGFAVLKLILALG